jgi:hypothetical protein
MLCASVSFIKQLISWVPLQFKVFTDLILLMMNLNQLRLILASLYIVVGCTLTLILILNQF